MESIMKLTSKYIASNLIRSDGGLNSVLVRNLQETKEELYCIYKEMPPKVCSNPNCTNITRFVSFNFGYKPYCSKKCGNSDKAKLAKMKETVLSNYGVSHQMLDSGVKSKMLASVSSRTEEQRESSLIKARITNTERYGKPSYSGSDACKNANISKYGNVHHMQNRDIQAKVVETNLSRYGVTCNLQDPNKIGEYMAKAYETKVNLGIIRSDEDVEDYEAYCRLVRKYTNRQPIKNLPEYALVGGRCTENDHHLDHIISKKFGFDNGILPSVIGDIDNLQVIHWKENTAKLANCWSNIHANRHKINT